MLPFFCVPGYSGNVLRFRNLGSYFAPDQPLYGLRDPRLEHKNVSFTQIEDIVPHYVKALLTHQPQGPYYVGGYSFGCLVALEVAQQLQKAGHRVKVLVFLDMPPSCRPQSPSLAARIRLLVKQKGLSATYKSIMRRLTLLTKRFTPNSVLPLALHEANFLAQTTYVPRAYPGRAIFFQTQNNRDIPRMWGNLIAGGIEAHDIPGDHETILYEPHVQVLAERLKTRLTQIQMQS